MRFLARCVVALVGVTLLAGCGTVVEGPPGTGPSSTPTSGRWVRVPESPLSARHEAAGAYLDGRHFVVGGWSNPLCPPTAGCRPPEEPPLKDGAAFDSTSGTWEAIAAAPTPVGGVLEMTVVGGKLYLLTGDLGRPDSPVTFLSYDPEDDAWATLASPPSAHPQVLAAGTKVVAVSGSDEYGPTSDAAFNPETGTWKRLPDDPLGPSFSRTAAWLGDRLLLTG